jgi:hypothetical protein
MNKIKQTKLLNKSYKKSFKCLNKNFFEDRNTGLLLFIEYLKYIRDSMILSSTEGRDEQLKITSIITAIAEFEAYNSCRDSRNKMFHWNNFHELVKQNMEEWLQINDSV